MPQTGSRSRKQSRLVHIHQGQANDLCLRVALGSQSTACGEMRLLIIYLQSKHDSSTDLRRRRGAEEQHRFFNILVTIVRAWGQVGHRRGRTAEPQGLALVGQAPYVYPDSLVPCVAFAGTVNQSAVRLRARA